jgi:hypothetical protein
MPHPSSATFRSLIDRWRVSDEQALELISYEGKLPTSGRRPRFRLSAEQARTVSVMLEVDSALAAAGIDPAWLLKRSDQMPRIAAGSDACRSNGRGCAFVDPGDATGICGASGRPKRAPRRLARGLTAWEEASLAGMVRTLQKYRGKVPPMPKQWDQIRSVMARQDTDPAETEEMEMED